MKTVAKIIESHGGLEWLRQPGNYIRLENPPYMRLVIEHIGDGPRGLANADLVRRIARMTAWKPLIPLEDFGSASVLLQSTAAAIRRLAPDRLRSTDLASLPAGMQPVT
jgi:hypothetical protein